MKLINNRWVIVGIVSFGDEECSGAGGVYTRVDYYYDWIMSYVSVPSTFKTTTVSTTETLPYESSSNTLVTFKVITILFISLLLA